MSAIERTGATHALVIFADIAEEQKTIFCSLIAIVSV
jgi:hypothetical protein